VASDKAQPSKVEYLLSEVLSQASKDARSEVLCRVYYHAAVELGSAFSPTDALDGTLTM
jgi:hypothetical protein